MQAQDRVYNFAAGPSPMPLEVLEQAQKELLNYNGTGMSILEMSHRSRDFEEILNCAEQDLRDLMHIPDTYEVLFLQGGGTTQFSMVPLNLFRKTYQADYLLSGSWAKKAAQEASKFGHVRIAASSEDCNFARIPQVTKEQLSADADYVYLCHNNTLFGTTWYQVPDTGNVPLAADVSSDILSLPIDVSKFGLLFAGAQKNIGPAGLTLAIVRKDLIGFAGPKTPVMLDYATHARGGSLYNTPPCFAIYMAGLTFRWIKKMGGVEAMEMRNKEKASYLYDFLDNSKLFRCPTYPDDRSRMNVVFVTGDPELDKKCIAEAKEQGLVNIGGHRSVGGMRASLYNAVTMEGVRALVDFLAKFEQENRTCIKLQD